MNDDFIESLEEYFSKTDKYEPGLGNLADSDEENIHQRNNYITGVVREFESVYRKTNAQRESYRGTFFWVTMVLLVVLILACVSVAFISVASLSENTIGSAAAIVASLATIIATVITLPQIIAKHLFPENERDKSIEMINAILQSDLEMRKYWNYDKMESFTEIS